MIGVGPLTDGVEFDALIADTAFDTNAIVAAWTPPPLQVWRPPALGPSPPRSPLWRAKEALRRARANGERR
jgi:hypothetical protein